MKGLLLAILIISVCVLLYSLQYSRSNFEPVSECSGHCFTNGKGQIMDDYDCCECKATITNQFEPNFHQCMCEAGYNDYCYLPVTNLLFSQ